MIWPHLLPLVALQLYDGKDNGEGEGATTNAITTTLVGSASLWVLLNVVFFCSINTSYLDTFFSSKTAPQYTCEYFTTSQLDFQRWDAVFTNRIAYSKNVHEDVKEWVANNIVRWKEEKPDFFYIEKIPDVSPQDRKESEENYC